MQIRAAIPEGSRRARNQPEALRAFEARIALDADLGKLRSDAEHNALLVARALVFSADWGTMVALPGWDTLIKRCGRSRSTIAKYLALFNAWGLLGRVRAGSTRRTRGHKSGDEDGNLAGEYVLCVPGCEPVEETRTPSLLRQEERSTACGIASRTRAREAAEPTWPIHQTPQTRGERRQAAQRLQQQIPLLGRLRSKRLVDLLTPWFELGWSPAQIRYALDHQVDGTPHWHTRDIRHVAGWLKHRLGLWSDQTPPRQLGAGQSTDLSAADVAALPRPGAAAVADAGEHASRIRELLAATAKRSDKKTPARLGLGVNLPDAAGRQSLVSEPVRPVERVADSGWLLRNAAARARTTPDAAGRVVA